MADPTPRVLSWDWREQPDLDALASAIRDLTDGRVRLTRVNTGSDQYAVVLSRGPLTADEAFAAYEAWWAS